MAAAQARQKSYADKRRKPSEFEVDDYVYLNVSPMRGVKHFGIKRKLEPRYVGPYQIIEKSGRVAYKLNLPREQGAIFSNFPCFSIEEMSPSYRGKSSHEENQIEIRSLL
jgi:hypothetical protein